MALSSRLPLVFACLVLSCRITPAQTAPSGCSDFAQIVGTGIRAQLTICSEAARALPGVRTQLDRLTALAEKNSEQQAEIARFVREVNAAAKLFKADKRIDTLSQSVSVLLQHGDGRTDAQLVRDIGTLARQLEDLRERIDEQSRRPETAGRASAAIAGELGDDIARLDVVSANKAFEAITRIEKKIDDLGARMDCNSATPQQLQLAIAAHLTDRVISMWHCHPENASAGMVEVQFAQFFAKQAFPGSRSFMEAVLASGWNFLMDTAPPQGFGRDADGWYSYDDSPLYNALKRDNIEGLEWLVAHAPQEYWKKYPYLLGDMLNRFPWYVSAPEAATIQEIGILRRAGVSADYSDYLPFRRAYVNWLQWEYPDELRKPLVTPVLTAIGLPHQGMSEYEASKTQTKDQAAQLKARWKTTSDALAPESSSALHSARSKTVTEFTDSQFQEANQEIQTMTAKLSQTWWRKLPETNAILQEAARRQAISVFDSYGYIRVVSGDLRDADVQPVNTKEPAGYPDCSCWVVKDVRERIAKASQRKAKILEFRSTQQ
jgi:hypothetical protein